MYDQGFTQTYPTATLKQMPLYKKALEIYALSRKLVEKNTTQTLRELYRSPIEQERLMEEMAVIALKLPFDIAIAQTSLNFKTKLHTSNNVLYRATVLKKHCKHLKKNRLAHQDLLSVFYKEVNVFKKMLKQWNVLLARQN